MTAVDHYVLDGREVGWDELFRRFGNERGLRILDAPLEAVAIRRRRLIAIGKASDPDFILSKEAYDAAADGVWTVRIDLNGDYRVGCEPT